MIALPVATRFAARSLWRNPRRTLLSIIGIGVACGLALVNLGITRGEGRTYGRAAAESGSGHVRISPGGWLKKKDDELRLVNWAAELAAVRALPNVKVATPRARLQGLLGMGNRLAAVEVSGVDPTTEQAALRFVRNVVKGRYLAADDRGATVIGKTVAERLKVDLDDELVVTAVRKDGEMESAMLRVVGIVTSGSRDVDAGICHVNLPDLEKLSGRAGAGEIAVLLVDDQRLEESRAAVAALLGPGDEALSWLDVAPELRAAIELDQRFALIVTTVIMLVVLLGVASAQLAAVLERRREFAVLSAVGMPAGRIARVLLVEALFLGLCGAAVGLSVGGSIVYRFATAGLDLRAMMDNKALEMGGIMADPILYADFGPWLVARALILCLGASMLASIYPAWFAARTDPADALRVAQ